MTARRLDGKELAASLRRQAADAVTAAAAVRHHRAARDRDRDA